MAGLRRVRAGHPVRMAVAGLGVDPRGMDIPKPVVIVGAGLIGAGAMSAVLLLQRPDPVEEAAAIAAAEAAAQAEATKAEICDVLTERLPLVCPGLSLRAAKCQADEDNVKVSINDGPDRVVSAGHIVSFGDTGPEWHVDADRNVWTSNEEAAAACDGMGSTTDLVRARARQAAALVDVEDPSACSSLDVNVGIQVLRRISAVGGAIDKGVLEAKTAEQQAVRDTADALGAEYELVRDIWAKVKTHCPEAL